MREIKFEYGFENHAPVKLTLKQIEFGLDLNFQEAGRVKYRRQFTGLKDKNGVEIYEGDIMKNKHDVFYVLWDDKHGGYKPSKNTTIFLDSAVLCLSEVIGNVYQNLELLEQIYD